MTVPSRRPASASKSWPLVAAAFAALAAAALSGAPAVRAVVAPAAPDTADTSVVAALTRDAVALAPLYKSKLVEEFLAAAPRLPAPSARTVWRDSAGTRWWTEAEHAKLSEAERALLVKRDLNERFWYFTRDGTPLAYARALEIVGARGVGTLEGLRVLDFGYGGAGSIALLGQGGADAVGVDVDPLLRALYAGDPAVEGWTGRAGGKARTVHGRWPADPAAVKAVGEGYDLVIAKNTLKNGYIHPSRKADPRQLIDLGVPDSVFVAEVARVLKPGGRFLIYNLSPAPSRPDEPYRPWTDGRSPFEPQLFTRAGLRVLAFDANDDAPARAMGKALGWDRGEGGMNLDSDLFGHYTLAEKPAAPAPAKR
jgi:SAM-dependent methyltransferase